MHIKPKVLNFGLSQFFQLSFNVKLTQLLPMICLRIYLYSLGILYFSLKRTERIKIALCLNYVLRPHLKAPQFYLRSIETFQGIFDHYYEKLIMAHRPLSEMMDFLHLHLRITGQEHLDEVAENGKGGILVTGHFGAVEFLPLTLAMKGYKIAMVCRFKTKKLREELMKRSEKTGVILIDADKPNVAFRALKAIKSGRILITECDEFSEWRPHHSEQISVFGHRVSRDKTLDFFYHRAKVPAFMGLIRREKKGFTLSIDPLADGYRDISLAAKAWERLESYILKYPQQWYQWKGAATQLAEYIIQDRKDRRQRIQHILTPRPDFS